MEKTIQKKLVEMFNTLDSPKKKIVNDWIVREKKVANCAIFIGGPNTSDQDGKEVCVMLKKAIDASDFSAFTGETPKPESKPTGKPALDAGTASGKVEVVHVGDKKEGPKKDPAPEHPAKQSERIHGNAGSLLETALVEFIHAHTSSVQTPAKDASAPASGTGLTEDQVRKIATEAANKVFDERINAAIADYFKRITG